MDGARRSNRRIRPLAAVVLAGSGIVAGCQDRNPGVDPPTDRFFFPQGLLLDPRTPDGEPARYLMVNNGNNNRRFNAGAVLTVDLERFFAAWATDPESDLTPYPYCEVDPDERVDDDDERDYGPGARCVRDLGSRTDALHPCRRMPLQPRIVECDEPMFIVGEWARIGTFATGMAASRRGPDPRLWVLVRNEPSITFMDVLGDPDDPPEFECGQDDGSRCDDEHRLTHLLNDRNLEALQREPFNILVDETDDYRYAYVAHAAGTRLSIVDLDGLLETEDPTGPRDGRPAIVQAPSVFSPSGGISGFTGGFGLAKRPCDTLASPSVTRNCRRPLVYGSFRSAFGIVSVSVAGLGTSDDVADVRCESGSVRDLEPGRIDCEAKVRSTKTVLVPGLDPTSPSIADTLGDIAFGDPSGETLFVLQTEPGALLRIDTSLDERGEPRDRMAGPPLELCDEPSHMRVWVEEQLAFVSCFQSAYLVVVDLAAFRVVETMVLGTGPGEVTLDPVRKVVYVANTLETSISVVDVDRTRRATYLKEVARIGLQEPFSK